MTKEEIDLIITILTRFLIKETATYKEFKSIETIIDKLSEIK